MQSMHHLMLQRAVVYANFLNCGCKLSHGDLCARELEFTRSRDYYYSLVFAFAVACASCNASRRRSRSGKKVGKQNGAKINFHH